MLSKSFRVVNRPATLRMFSSNLLVPLPQKAEAPAEMVEGFTMTKAFLQDLHAKHAEYNLKCVADLQEMNENKIANIL